MFFFKILESKTVLGSTKNMGIKKNVLGNLSSSTENSGFQNGNWGSCGFPGPCTLFLIRILTAQSSTIPELRMASQPSSQPASPRDSSFHGPGFPSKFGSKKSTPILGSVAKHTRKQGFDSRGHVFCFVWSQFWQHQVLFLIPVRLSFDPLPPGVQVLPALQASRLRCRPLQLPILRDGNVDENIWWCAKDPGQAQSRESRGKSHGMSVIIIFAAWMFLHARTALSRDSHVIPEETRMVCPWLSFLLHGCLCKNCSESWGAGHRVSERAKEAIVGWQWCASCK